MQFPKLYSENANGALIEWQIFVENNYYYCIYGQTGGSLIRSAETHCNGKNLGKSNETSPEEQAEKEAAAEYKKKLEQGGYFLSPYDVSNQSFFSPQLAKSWEDYENNTDLTSGLWCMSPKLDGVRAIIRDSGAFSRNGKEFKSFPHIRELLDPIFQQNKDIVIDGEIYQHAFKHNFNKIISLAKKTKPNQDDINESAKLLEFWIFDVTTLKPDNTQFATRLKNIEKIISSVNDSRIKMVEHIPVSSKDHIKEYLSECLGEGFEGLMLKNLSARYQCKRTKDILKYKIFQSDEFRILDIVEGVGNRSGKFGYAKLCTDGGTTFSANARGDESFYIDLLENKYKYINQMATVRFQNYTPDGIPRFPVIVSIRNYE